MYITCAVKVEFRLTAQQELILPVKKDTTPNAADTPFDGIKSTSPAAENTSPQTSSVLSVVIASTSNKPTGSGLMKNRMSTFSL